MAKKKQELTSAELLAEALVREEDWPYAVPGNWVWVRLESVVACSKEKFNDFDGVDEKKYIGLEHIQKDLGIIGHGSSNDIKSQKSVFEVGDILYGKLRPYLNKHDIADFEGICSTDILVLKTKPICVNKLLNYYLNTDYFICNAIANSKGINLPRVSETIVLDANFPLPPLAEQQRIVNRIESLFDQLDQAKDLIQDALDSFENRKAAILHQAFTGQLTKKWREAHGVGLESWEEKPISNYIISLNQGWSPKCESFPSLDINEWGVIKTTAIQHMEFNEIENKQLPKHLEPKVQYELIDGDILITRAGPRIRVGVCCLVKNVRPKLLLCDKAYRIRLNSEKVLNEFFVMQLNTNEKLFEINKMKTGISDSGVNLTQKGFLEIQIKVPPLKEQQEIVRILDDLFEKEQNAKDLCDLIDQIEAIKKTILVQAFRGELGTNEAGEESAVALLEAVLQ